MKRLLVIFTLITACLPCMASKPLKPINWQTSKGAQVVFFQAMEVPMLEIRVAFAAGSAYDDHAYGLSALTTDLLNQGNGGEDATAIAEQLAETGAQYHSESTRDMVVLNLKTLTESSALNPAIKLFAKIISKPDFEKTAFEREKQQQLMAIKHSLESPNEIANQAFFNALYQDHPYAHPVIGTQETVKAITIDNVRKFYTSKFVNNNAIIVLVGAINQDQAKQIAERLTKDLPKGHAAQKLPKALPLQEPINIAIPFPASQTFIRIGELGISHRNKNYFPLLVGNYTLGGGTLVSQLGLEVREKRGLTYGITSQFLPLPAVGPFVISLSTQTSQAETAIDITRNTLSQFVKKGPSEEELGAAKHYLTGSYPLSLASNSSIAAMLLKIAFYKLPDDFLDTYIERINKVTSSEIKMAFKDTIIPTKLLQVTVGKP